MVTLTDQQIAHGIRAALFILLMLKHPQLADFVASHPPNVSERLNLTKSLPPSPWFTS